MLMLGPPHPGAFTRRQCVATLLGPDGHGSQRRAWRGLAQHAVDATQRPLLRLAGDGDPAVRGFRRQSRKLADAAEAVRISGTRCGAGKESLGAQVRRRPTATAPAITHDLSAGGSPFAGITAVLFGGRPDQAGSLVLPEARGAECSISEHFAAENGTIDGPWFGPYVRVCAGLPYSLTFREVRRGRCRN